MVKDIIIPKLKTIEADDTHGVFEIEPYYPGYGITVGNSLRRVLLTSLPGAAITGVEIDGVSHEFTAVDGVKEDVMEILLNLKGVKMTFFASEPVEVELSVDSEGDVTAGDIETTADIEITNPDHHIATITDDNGELDMKLRIEEGRGYKTTEELDTEDLPTTWLSLDAIFSPVERVSYDVENTRVGEVVDYDKLTIEIDTDGTIPPEEALKNSADLLIDQLSVFLEDSASVTEEETAEEPEDELEEDYLVSELNMSTRTINRLQDNQVEKVSDIKELGLEGVEELKGIGAKTVDEIADALEEIDIELT